MMGFIEWVHHERKRKEKEDKDVRSNSQAVGEIRSQILQGEAPRANSEVEYQRVSYFPEP
jgi:hypothetical protein